jgi:hypothetical protein
MSRTLHDEFAKDWMKEFLSDFGTVETEFAISGEVRSVDVYFQPNPEGQMAANSYNNPSVIGRFSQPDYKTLPHRTLSQPDSTHRNL